jgi:hypothetical protein
MKTVNNKPNVSKEAIIAKFYFDYKIPVTVEQCNYPHGQGVKYFTFSTDYYNEAISKSYDDYTIAIFRVKFKTIKAEDKTVKEIPVKADARLFTTN